MSTTSGPRYPDEPDLHARSENFARQLELDGWLQAERHITAAGFWGNFQWVLGGASAVLAAAASGTAFADLPVIAGVIALLAAAAAALVTALRPADLSTQHLQAASAFHGLQIAARDLWEFDLSTDPLECRDQIRALGDRWTAAIAGSPRIPRRIYRVSADLSESKGMNYFPSPSASKRKPHETPPADLADRS
jgi:hypothetical protein